MLNGLLDTLDDLNIGVIVLLQELEVESVSHFTLENGGDLGESLLGACLIFILILTDLGVKQLQNFCLERLVLFVTDVESDLVGIKVSIILSLGQFFQKGSSSLWLLQIELTLCNLVVIKVARVISVLVNEEQKCQYLSSEVLALDDILCDGECVCKVFLDKLI